MPLISLSFEIAVLSSAARRSRAPGRQTSPSATPRGRCTWSSQRASRCRSSTPTGVSCERRLPPSTPCSPLPGTLCASTGQQWPNPGAAAISPSAPLPCSSSTGPASAPGHLAPGALGRRGQQAARSVGLSLGESVGRKGKLRDDLAEVRKVLSRSGTSWAGWPTSPPFTGTPNPRIRARPPHSDIQGAAMGRGTAREDCDGWAQRLSSSPQAAPGRRPRDARTDSENEQRRVPSPMGNRWPVDTSL
jgi:hypothetical protein